MCVCVWVAFIGLITVLGILGLRVNAAYGFRVCGFNAVRIEFVNYSVCNISHL